MMKTKSDPTGQKMNRKRGLRVLEKRLLSAEKSIKAAFRSIPKTRIQQKQIVNAETVAVYDYTISPQAQQDLGVTIGFTLNQQLLGTQSDLMPLNWYWQDEIERPYRQGTIEEVRDFDQAVAAAVVAGLIASRFVSTPSPQQIVFNPSYQDGLQKAYIENFNSIKSLSQRTASQVIERINSGIAAGDTPTDIIADITNRFEVAKSNAKRIVDTEINKAYNDGKISANEILAVETGLRSAVIHISALTTTTRSSHAARHGNAYTPQQQQQWWSTGSNRINCLCTVRTVLVDRNNKILDPALQSEIKAERVFFED